MKKLKPLTMKQYHKAWDRLYRQRPAELHYPEPAPEEGFCLPEGIPDTVGLPVFSVSVGATQILLNKRDLAVLVTNDRQDDVEILLRAITPKLTPACAEEFREALELIEKEYVAVLEPVCAELRRLRSVLAAGYLGHSEDHVASIATFEEGALVESSTTERETEDVLDKKAEKASLAFDAELKRRVKAAGLVKPPGREWKISTRPKAAQPALRAAWKRYNVAVFKIEQKLRAEQLAEQRKKAAANAGMVA
jgi:hypothetical protein